MTINSFNEAQNRIPSQRQKIVNQLREAGEEGLTTADLAAISLQYNTRLTELSKEGYGITCEPIKDGLYKYVLKAVPGAVVIHPSAEEVIYLEMIKEFNSEVAGRLMELLHENDFQVVRKSGWYKKRMLLH